MRKKNFINWWSMILDDTFAFFDLNGDHSGNNETTFIQAKDYYE
ncbi:MAG: hypothetical protein RLN90_14080 [Balneolaceae bacterium]